MSRFLKIYSNVQIFEQLLHATIANLIGHIGLSVVNSSPVHQYQEKKRRLRLLFMAIFWGDPYVFQVKIPKSIFEIFRGK